MKLEEYMAKDHRLSQVNALAKKLYGFADLKLHNYDHALWDTEKIITIAEAEGHKDIALTISAALMHDSGVSSGPYSDHPENGGSNVRFYLPEIGFDRRDVEEIAVAVQEHNGLKHSSDTSRYLFDADTLNKSGAHGIGQCMMVGEEFGLDFGEMAARFSAGFAKLVEKGFYTGTARDIDREMGNQEYPGLELNLEFWRRADILLRDNYTGDIYKKLREDLKIEDGS